MTILRLRNCSLLTYSESVFQHLSTVQCLSIPITPTTPCHRHLELLFGPTMASDRILGEEGSVVAHTWRTWNMVDRYTN